MTKSKHIIKKKLYNYTANMKKQENLLCLSPCRNEFKIIDYFYLKSNV